LKLIEPKRQPDDPGVPEPTEEETRQGRRNANRLILNIILVAALIVVTIFAAWRTAAAQDPPVPLEEPCPAGNCVVYNQAHIYAFTGDERTIRWSLVQSDVDSMALFTELQVFEFPPPDHGVILCSIIASSTDPTYTDPGVYPRGFVMLIKIPPATGGGIE
jgi:hypothetical protein